MSSKILEDLQQSVKHTLNLLMGLDVVLSYPLQPINKVNKAFLHETA